MKKAGYSAEEMRAILSGNFCRVFGLPPFTVGDAQ
jgi:microsomal dipeptidase-like Zn-dependent dipeptidase